MYADLGGDNLLPSFVEVGEVDGANYALPYYFGSRYIFYRKDVWAAAGLDASQRPSTSSTSTAATLKTDTQSGFYIGGEDWRNGISWIFANGGDLAKKDGDKWTSTLSDPNTIEGLEQLQAALHERFARPGHRGGQHPVGQHQQQRDHGCPRGRDDHRTRMGALVDR